MKILKWILIILIIIAITIFTGTWLLNILSEIFSGIGKTLGWLAKIMDFFGLAGKVFGG